MPKIVKIESSPVKMKRYRVYLENGEKFDFGLEGGKTYIDGVSDLTRKSYKARHLGNLTEKKLIENLIPSPSLFSFYLLWNTPSLEQNIKILNKLL